MKKENNTEYICLKDVGYFFNKNGKIFKSILLDKFTENGIKCLIEDGYIKEIQKPEFTKKDLFSYFQFLLTNYNKTIIVTKEGFENSFNHWQNKS